MGMQHINRKRRMHRWAKEKGVPIPKGFRALTPTWGSPARELVRRIKARAFGPSQADTVWDARIGRLLTPTPNVGAKALAIAKREVGVKESPANSNDGKRVRVYQSVTGAYRAPWCASFTAWAYREAGRPLKGFNTAYVPSYVHAAKRQQHGLSVVAATDVRPGDLACFDWQADGVADHIGLVDSPPMGGTFTCVEGNTSAKGSQSNGGEVMHRTRSTRQVQVFIRVSERG